MTTLPVPSISEVERIATLDDPVIRNLQITQCYHELALVLAARTGGSANWCTFATWASKQAGQTIRKEDLASALEQILGTQRASGQTARALAAAARRAGKRLGLEESLAYLWRVLDPEAAFTRSSEAVARGNQKVFAEIGREFARFCAACLPDTAYDEKTISGFCEHMRPGEPPQGQHLLRRAFRHYYQALFEERAKPRAELLLLANLEIGLHEQTRLQPEINEAMVAPVIPPGDFVRNLLKTLHPDWGWMNEIVWFFLRLFGALTELDSALAAYLEAAQREAHFLITETMMTIELPSLVRLRLGDDLSAGYPPLLAQIASPDLRSLLARIDPTPDSLLDSGADYWGDLPDRLHFIAELFRCYQESQELFEPPFTADQVLALKAGRLPAGRL